LVKKYPDCLGTWSFTPSFNNIILSSSSTSEVVCTMQVSDYITHQSHPWFDLTHTHTRARAHTHTHTHTYIYIYIYIYIRGCIQKFPDWVDEEINNNNNKHSLRSNTKGYGGKIH
jgi:hypothetical protein